MHQGMLTDMKIKDLGRVVTGKTPPTSQPEQFGDLYPFITPSDIPTFDARYVDCERGISDKGFIRQKNYALPKDAVCYVCIGSTIGKICMTKKVSFTNQQINSIIVNESRFVPKYVYYLLRTLTPKIQAISGGTGAGKAILNKSSFEDIDIRVHPLEEQHQIASVLSAYDDLIENNSRRMSILEEMARNLYREWFVKFRFPGYENTQWIQSESGMIPEGWGITQLGDVADIQWGDTSTTKASYKEEGYPAYSASGLDGLMDHYDFDREGVVISAIGANCGKTWYAKGKWSCIKNTIRFWSNDENKVSTVYLYLAANNPDIWPKRGAAQPFISLGDAKTIKIIVPDYAIQKKFTEFAGDILDQIRILEIKNGNLRSARDLLIPKLVSGALDIQNLKTDSGGV